MKRTRFSSTQSLASKSSKGSYGKRTISTKGGAQRSLVNYTRNPSIPRWGFPRRMYMVHKYSETTTVTSTTGSLVSQLFRANGLHDPNQTGTGHQPMYYDNLLNIYDHYTVVKAKAKITITPSAVPTTAALCAFYTDDDTSIATTLEAAVEQSDGSFIHIPNGYTGRSFVMTKEWSARKFFGGDPLSNDNLQGSSGANPTEESHFVFMYQCNSVGTNSVFVTCEIEYFTVWDELKTQALN